MKLFRRKFWVNWRHAMVRDTPAFSGPSPKVIGRTLDIERLRMLRRSVDTIIGGRGEVIVLDIEDADWLLDMATRWRQATATVLEQARAGGSVVWERVMTIQCLVPGCPRRIYNHKFGRPYWFSSTEEAARFIRDSEESGKRDGWTNDGDDFYCGEHSSLRTKMGQVLTDADVEKLADEAEQGRDFPGDACCGEAVP
jgi:hypothetical protein